MIQFKPGIWECKSNCKGLSDTDIRPKTYKEEIVPGSRVIREYNGYMCTRCGTQAVIALYPVGGPIPTDKILNTNPHLEMDLPIEPMLYIALKIGDIIQVGDEYQSTSGVWQTTPITGSPILNNGVNWRRPVVCGCQESMCGTEFCPIHGDWCNCSYPTADSVSAANGTCGECGKKVRIYNEMPSCCFPDVGKDADSYKLNPGGQRS